MTAVTIRPTFKKDSRPNNGLEDAADAMQADKTRLFRVVGTMKYAGASISEEGEITPAAKFVTLEVVYDDEDVRDVVRMTDKRRRQRGLGNEKDIPVPGQLAGQQPFDFDGPDDGEPRRVGEVRLGPDGPREVPPATAEEELAERAEAKAKRSKADREAAEASVTAAAAEVPAAQFSGGDS